jgi:CRISPR-associated protein Cas1
MAQAQRKGRRPQAVMMSRRANMFYLEHVRLLQKDNRVLYLTETKKPIEQLVNIPDKNTSFVLLGKGTSITDSAMRMLAESNVIVGFCGSGGSPMHALSDISFMVPQDEYRPTEYMQSWAKNWFDEATRLMLAKTFLLKRLSLNTVNYPKITGITLPETMTSDFTEVINTATNTTSLLTAEGRYAKNLYKFLSYKYNIEFTRDAGQGKGLTIQSIINSYLDHGNYLAYGCAATALHTLGISYAFPVLHGKTRRGALVFDVADIIKDWIIMPIAFEYGVKKAGDKEFRAALINRLHDFEALDLLITFVKEVALTPYLNQQVTEIK